MLLDFDGLDGLFHADNDNDATPAPGEPAANDASQQPLTWPAVAITAGVGAILFVAAAAIASALKAPGPRPAVASAPLAQAATVEGSAANQAQPATTKPTTGPVPPPALQTPPSAGGGAPLADIHLPFRFGVNRRTPDPLTAEGVIELDAALRNLAERCGPAAIQLTGHTDSRGLPAENLILGLHRATHAREALAHRASTPPIIAATAGSTRPVASNATREGQSANRRVTASCASSPPRKEITREQP